MSLSWTTAIEIIKLSNVIVQLELKLSNDVIHNSGNWTCNNSNNKIGRKKIGQK